MNEWLVAVCVLVLGGIVPCGVVAALAPLPHGVVALGLGGIFASLAMLSLAEGVARQPFADLAVVLGVLSFVGAVAFARFIERDL